MRSMFFYFLTLLNRVKQSRLYVTQSGKTGLIAYFKESGNAGFKYLVCCSSPMVGSAKRKFDILPSGLAT